VVKVLGVVKPIEVIKFANLLSVNVKDSFS
jgi:hypothetical protein